MKLIPHQGWATHSNNIMRCHYGISVPEYCFISVCNKGVPPLYNESDIIRNSIS